MHMGLAKKAFILAVAALPLAGCLKSEDGTKDKVQISKDMCANPEVTITAEDAAVVLELAGLLNLAAGDQVHYIETGRIRGEAGTDGGAVWTAMQLDMINSKTGQSTDKAYLLFNNPEGWGCDITQSTFTKIKKQLAP